MVSEGGNDQSIVTTLQNFTVILERALNDLESEIVLVRDSFENLRVSNRDLHLELLELNQGIAQLNQRLDNTPTGVEDEEIQVEAQPVLEEAQPVEGEERPLQISDQVRITSRQLFGTVGVVHSFTNQRVRVQVEGRRRLVVRSANNLQRL